jgi:hypothetical protein
MSEKPHCAAGSQGCTISVVDSAESLRIKEINQNLRILVTEIMESKTHIKGSYDTAAWRSFPAQTAMKVQVIDRGCTKEVSGCI